MDYFRSFDNIYGVLPAAFINFCRMFYPGT
jgi:hypothetical protein